MPVLIFALALLLIYLAVTGKLAAIVYVIFGNKT